VAVLRLPATYWSANPAQREAVENIVAALDNPDSAIRAGIKAFREATSA
jgi:hypothetical protein